MRARRQYHGAEEGHMDGQTLYLNAIFHTMDPATPRAEAMLVQGDRIAAVGSRQEVEAAARWGVRSVDLEGRTVVPGFDDCHCHILSFGLDLERLDVSPEAVRTIEDIKRAVAEKSQAAAEGEWILGRGYNQNVLAERRHPNRRDLDEVSGGRPVVLWHTSGHALTCNSAALQAAGVTAHTETPPGGEIEREADGRPNGVLKESAMDLVDEAVPVPSQQLATDAVLRAMQVMASQGITSASDAATGQHASVDDAITAYRRALESGKLAGRITLMPQIGYVAPPGSEGVRAPDSFDTGDQPLWLRIGPTKIFSDGALTTRTAAVRHPFADSDNHGILIWERETLADMIRRANGAGWQIGTHAIGDRAIELVLDCYEQALRERPRDDHRHRIEHCMLLDRSLGQRIRQLGVIPTIQPGFMSRLGDGYIAALGRERAAQLMPMRLFIDLGIPVGFSSDRPVIPGLPLQGVRAAVERRTPDGVTLGPEHTVSALDAIRLYTAGSAYATHSERDRGALRPSFLADFTVLSRDPATTPAEEFGEIQVTMTVVGGNHSFEI